MEYECSIRSERIDESWKVFFFFRFFRAFSFHMNIENIEVMNIDKWVEMM